MRDEVKSLQDELDKLNAVVDSVVADHEALVAKLNAAVSDQDWSAVSTVAKSLDSTVEKLKGILPSS